MKYRILESSTHEFFVEYKEYLFWHSCFYFSWGCLSFNEYICCDDSWYEKGIFCRSEADRCLSVLKNFVAKKYPNPIVVKTVYEE